MPGYAIDRLTPVVDPAYLPPSAVLIGDVIIGPGCYVDPCASRAAGGPARSSAKDRRNDERRSRLSRGRRTFTCSAQVRAMVSPIAPAPAV